MSSMVGFFGVLRLLGYSSVGRKAGIPTLPFARPLLARYRTAIELTAATPAALAAGWRMKFRSLIFASLWAVCLPDAGGASRLAVTAPAGWKSVQDPQTQLTVLVAPDNGALMTFIASTPFTGTAKQWHEDRWSQLVQGISPAAPPQNAELGSFLTRAGVFRNSDGTQPWIRLYTTLRDGLGEGLLFIASNEQQFLAWREAVDRQVRASSLEAGPIAPTATPAATAPAKPTAVPAPNAAKSDGAVAGLYLATTRQLRFNPLGGSGSADWEVRTEYYLLSRDGQVFRGRDLPSVPGGDLARFDFAAARREVPGNYGVYEASGDLVRFQLGGTGGDRLEAKRISADILEIQGTRFTRSVPEKKTEPPPATR